MRDGNSWIECDTRYIVAHHQPACLIDLAKARGLDSHRILRGTGLFYEDLLSGNILLSVGQFERLVDNVRSGLNSDDLPFLFGQQLLPGHFGSASQAFEHSQNLLQALERLVALQTRLTPLMLPLISVDSHFVHLYWVDFTEASDRSRFVVEASMTAITAATRWLAGRPLTWEYRMRHRQPRYLEQYRVHLGETLHFDEPIDVMSVPREQAMYPWLRVSPIAGQAALKAARDESDGVAFLQSVFDALCESIQRAPGLDSMAERFEMSSATFKRKLHKHGTHYQGMLDRARLLVAVDLYRSKGYSHDQVAGFLGFNDRANYRRSFKRWAGTLPSQLTYARR